MTHTIILADDDRSISVVLNQVFSEHGYHVLNASNTREMMQHVEQGKGDLVITDVMMPGETGLEALPRLKQIRPELPVIVISAQNTLMTAVESNELGAFDYLPKPFDLNELLSTIEKTLKAKNSKNPSPNSAKSKTENTMPLVGRSPAMQTLYKIMSRVISNDLTMLIEGESGTGKEVIAQSIHDLSKRKNAPFVAVNMAAIPRDLVESELFGHEKGAFTGASQRKAGKFEQASGGTLFLDEIGDMPMEAQTKLLRVLQQGEFTPVGGNRAIATDVRIICATHRHLRELIAEQKFREDLYYRLNVIPLTVPPLRLRREDIPELCDYFLRKAQEKDLAACSFSSQAHIALQQYHWPGNVRELENMVYRLCALSTEPIIDEPQIRAELRQILETENAPSLAIDSIETWATQQVHSHLLHNSVDDSASLTLYDRLLHQLEKPMLEAVLTHTKGNQIKAAELLGINRNTLRKKIAYLNITPTRWVGDNSQAA